MILNCKDFADRMNNAARQNVQTLYDRKFLPGKIRLVVIQAGDDPASSSYIAGKRKDCEAAGIEFELRRYPETVTTEELQAAIGSLNDDKEVTAVLIQFPLPDHVDKSIIQELAWTKDADGLVYSNAYSPCADSITAPCTPLGIVAFLNAYFQNKDGVNPQSFAGKTCVIIGRSEIVGRPLANMMSMYGATVTVCNRTTPNLGWFTRGADIVVVAAGCPGLLTADMVAPGAVVIDVGINRTEDGRLVGDADTEAIAKIADITPVPGGVGLLTRAALLRNVSHLAFLQAYLEAIKD